MPEQHSKLAQALGQAERGLAQEVDEIAYIFAVDGSLEFSRHGQVDWVDLSDLNPEQLEGRVLTHNHPRGTSLSWQDVRLLLTYRLAEIRVVTGACRYSLRLPVDTEWEDAEDLIEILTDQTREEHRDRILAGRLTFDDSERTFYHDVWSALAELRGWDYRREPWTSA